MRSDDELFNAAEKGRENAYPRASDFHVGAALEAEDGSIVIGCNVENASLGGTICAERTAMLTAVASGKSGFVRIAIVSDSVDPIPPCGMCRQFLAEFSRNAEVISRGTSKVVKRWKMADLLPEPFTFADWKKPK